MTRSEAWCNHAANLAVGGSGLVYGWMLYFVTSTDEFAIVNHPAQPALHSLHVLSAPLLVFAIGLLWTRHAWGRVRSGFRGRRKTGLVLVALALPMVLSGYAIQVAVDEDFREGSVITHVASSILWILAYVVHQWSSRATARG